MSKRIKATEVRARFFAILDEVASGEVIEITRRGHIIARLSPARGPHSLWGLYEGIAMTADPEDDLYSTGATWNLP
jgi:prevent-host-death family protein